MIDALYDFNTLSGPLDLRDATDGRKPDTGEYASSFSQISNCHRTVRITGKNLFLQKYGKQRATTVIGDGFLLFLFLKNPPVRHHQQNYTRFNFGGSCFSLGSLAYLSFFVLFLRTYRTLAYFCLLRPTYSFFISLKLISSHLMYFLWSQFSFCLICLI